MTVTDMRQTLGMSRAAFSRAYNIPVRTLEEWEAGRRTPPDYVMSLLERCVREDREKLEAEPVWQVTEAQAEQARHPEDLTKQEIIDNRFL